MYKKLISVLLIIGLLPTNALAIEVNIFSGEEIHLSLSDVLKERIEKRRKEIAEKVKKQELERRKETTKKSKEKIKKERERIAKEVAEKVNKQKELEKYKEKIEAERKKKEKEYKQKIIREGIEKMNKERERIKKELEKEAKKDKILKGNNKKIEEERKKREKVAAKKIIEEAKRKVIIGREEAEKRENERKRQEEQQNKVNKILENNRKRIQEQRDKLNNQGGVLDNIIDGAERVEKGANNTRDFISRQRSDYNTIKEDVNERLEKIKNDPELEAEYERQRGIYNNTNSDYKKRIQEQRDSLNKGNKINSSENSTNAPMSDYKKRLKEQRDKIKQQQENKSSSDSASSPMSDFKRKIQEQRDALKRQQENKSSNNDENPISDYKKRLQEQRDIIKQQQENKSSSDSTTSPMSDYKKKIQEQRDALKRQQDNKSSEGPIDSPMSDFKRKIQEEREQRKKQQEKSQNTNVNTPMTKFKEDLQRQRDEQKQPKENTEYMQDNLSIIEEDIKNEGIRLENEARKYYKMKKEGTLPENNNDEYRAKLKEMKYKIQSDAAILRELIWEIEDLKNGKIEMLEVDVQPEPETMQLSSSGEGNTSYESKTMIYSGVTIYSGATVYPGETLYSGTTVYNTEIEYGAKSEILYSTGEYNRIMENYGFDEEKMKKYVELNKKKDTRLTNKLRGELSKYYKARENCEKTGKNDLKCENYKIGNGDMTDEIYAIFNNVYIEMINTTFVNHKTLIFDKFRKFDGDWNLKYTMRDKTIDGYVYILGLKVHISDVSNLLAGFAMANAKDPVIGKISVPNWYTELSIWQAETQNYSQGNIILSDGTYSNAGSGFGEFAKRRAYMDEVEDIPFYYQGYKLSDSYEDIIENEESVDQRIRYKHVEVIKYLFMGLYTSQKNKKMVKPNIEKLNKKAQDKYPKLKELYR